MNRQISRLKPALPLAFGDLPVSSAKVHRMSPEDETSGRAGYRTPPAADAPGAYRLDLKAIRSRPSWTLTSAGFHEVTPGHLFQMALQTRAPVPSPGVF